MKRPQEAQHGWQLHQKLQPAANYRSPGDNDCQTGLTLMSALPEKCGDNSHVPDDRSSVRKQKLAMAVENAQAPGGENQKSCAGKKDLHQPDCQQALIAGETGGNDIDEPGCGKNSQHNEKRGG